MSVIAETPATTASAVTFLPPHAAQPATDVVTCGQPVKRNFFERYSMFGLMFLQWGLLTVDFRALAQASYLVFFLADVVTAVVGFTILKKVQQATTMGDMIQYTLGGALGSQAALYLTVHFLPK